MDSRKTTTESSFCNSSAQIIPAQIISWSTRREESCHRVLFPNFPGRFYCPQPSQSWVCPCHSRSCHLQGGQGGGPGLLQLCLDPGSLEEKRGSRSLVPTGHSWDLQGQLSRTLNDKWQQVQGWEFLIFQQLLLCLEEKGEMVWDGVRSSFSSSPQWAQCLGQPRYFNLFPSPNHLQIHPWIHSIPIMSAITPQAAPLIRLYRITS